MPSLHRVPVSFAVLVLLVLDLLVASCWAAETKHTPMRAWASEAQRLKVLVLDAVSGKPQRKMQVSFYCRDSRRNYSIEEVDTNSEGVVIIPYTCKGEGPQIVIDVTGLPKEQCGSSAIAATIEEISSMGIISAPDAAGEMHCATKISGKLKPVPGQVIIFVKKPSWWQSHF